MAITNPAFKLTQNASSGVILGVNVLISEGFLTDSSVRNLEELISEGVDNIRYRVRNATPRSITITTAIPIQSQATLGTEPFIAEEGIIARMIGRLGVLTLMKPERSVDDVMVLNATILSRGGKTISAGVPSNFTHTIVCRFRMRVI